MKILYFILLLPLILTAQVKKEKITLFYANNEFIPTTKHLKTIDSIKSLYKPEEFSIILNGYSNEIGKSAYNLKLSEKRVNAIANEFIGYNITSFTAKGEIEGNLVTNRRVDIEIKISRPKIEQKAVEPIDSILIVKDTLLNNFNQLKVGEKIALNNIYFIPGTDLIKDESNKSLNELLSYLRGNSEKTIKILGHVCCTKYKNRAIDGYNTRTGKRKLSSDRAKSVYTYLIKNGIHKRRLKYEGLASKFPLNKGDDLDRRVEIEIIN